MPVAVVVGGQFGSEGKGKVALEFARAATEKDITLVRVGGPNSGHTGYDRHKKRFALRQLPAGSIDRNVDVVFPAGSYIDVELLLSEIDLLRFPSDRIFISNYARIVLPEHKAWEQEGKLGNSIGSTGSGVGGAVMASVARGATNFPLVSLDAQHCEPLQGFVCDTTALLRSGVRVHARAKSTAVEATPGTLPKLGSASLSLSLSLACVSRSLRRRYKVLTSWA